MSVDASSETGDGAAVVMEVGREAGRVYFVESLNRRTILFREMKGSVLARN